jgi:hypothetical protein
VGSDGREGARGGERGREGEGSRGREGCVERGVMRAHLDHFVVTGANKALRAICNRTDEAGVGSH